MDPHNAFRRSQLRLINRFHTERTKRPLVVRKNARFYELLGMNGVKETLASAINYMRKRQKQLSKETTQLFTKKSSKKNKRLSVKERTRLNISYLKSRIKEEMCLMRLAQLENAYGEAIDHKRKCEQLRSRLRKLYTEKT